MATKTARHFCPTCGFPLRGGSACDACGSEREPVELRDGERRAWPRADAPVPPGLERAAEAWASQDYARGTQLALADLGAMPTSGSEAPSWVVEIDHRVILVSLTPADGKITIETPVAHLPEKLRVAALRASLEGCDEPRLGARLALRTDRVVARWLGRVASLSPAVVRDVVHDVASFARAMEARLVDHLGGRVVPQEASEARAGWGALGRAKRINGKMAPKDRSIPPPAPSSPVREEPVRPRPTKQRSVPPLVPEPPPLAQAQRAPAFPKPLPIPPIPPIPPAPAPLPIPEPRAPIVEARPAQPIADVRPAPAAATLDDDLPPILSPMFAAQQPAPPSPPRIPSPLPAAEPARTSDRPRVPREDPPSEPTLERRRQAATLPEPGLRPNMAMPATMAGIPAPRAKASMPEIDLEPITRVRNQSGEHALSPADRLCELLQKAQSLAILVGPRADCARWLVRSTAFRAYYEFYDTVPDAVAQLYRATARDPHSPEGPLAVMERLIAVRANVAKEKPLAIDPMTTASQAKDHAARYLSEIEAAPNDPALRHFMALGALAELMVRTKLPASTEQRLREIVTHARREGPKASSVELLMTALARIGS